MSQVYATEPATSGRVLLETTHGPIEIQLWCRECPLTTRLFLQLALDGFYNDMSFHRIVPDFLIQTGAIRSTNNNVGMDAEYRHAVDAQEALDRRKYEVHSRLRFNHRGQVAMALGVSDDDDTDAAVLQPQFFITLDEAPYLDGKHVLFGTVVGPTVFNALRIGRTHVEEETELDIANAPRVLSVTIVDNPIFTDLVAQTNVPWKTVVTTKKAKKKKRKGKRDFNVLSFGNEMQDDEEIGTAGIKSSHDVVQSQALSNKVDDRVKEAVTSAAGEKIVERRTNHEDEEEVEEDEVAVAKSETVWMESAREPNLTVPDAIQHSEKQQVTERAADKPDESRRSKPPTKKGAVESRLAKYKKKSSTDKKQREEDTMAKLFAFQGKVRKQATSGDTSQNGHGPRDDGLAAKMARKLKDQQESREGRAFDEAPTYHGQILEHSDDEDERSKDAWLSTKFKCRKNMDMDSRAGADGRNMDDYRVVDDKRNGRDDREDNKHGHHRDRKRRKHHSKHHGDRRCKHG